MDYMDSNKIGQRIENKLIHALGRTISEATNDEIYKAAAECIRDDIMISWADSRKRIQEQGVKKLYYMSAEFLNSTTSVQISSGVNVVRTLSLLTRFRQYLQS